MTAAASKKTGSLYKQFETDKDLETRGVVLNFSDGVSIRVARAGGSNDRYMRRMEVLTKPYRRQIESKTADNKVLEKIVLEVFCETVILGWDGVEDRNGNVLAFNKENAMMLFTDLPDLFAEVKSQATDEALFRLSLNEADAKN